MASSDRNEGILLLNIGSHKSANPKTRGIVWGFLTTIFVFTLVIILGFPRWLGQSFAIWVGLLPDDPTLAVLTILDRAPVIVSRKRCIMYAHLFLLY